jgi:hypothetical protein
MVMMTMMRMMIMMVMMLMVPPTSMMMAVAGYVDDEDTDVEMMTALTTLMRCC